MLRENVWDYPRPPRLERVPQTIRIVFASATIAETETAWRVLETSHPPVYYLPREAFGCEILPTRGGSFCEWKGQAVYWSLRVERRTAEACAWSYPDPTPTFTPIRDHLAVYAWPMDGCLVGESSFDRT